MVKITTNIESIFKKNINKELIMKLMADKVVLITGAAQGIGFASAKAFAQAGASVALADYDKDLVNKAAEQLNYCL